MHPLQERGAARTYHEEGDELSLVIGRKKASGQSERDITWMGSIEPRKKSSSISLHSEGACHRLI